MRLPYEQATLRCRSNLNFHYKVTDKATPLVKAEYDSRNHMHYETSDFKCFYWPLQIKHCLLGTGFGLYAR